MRAPHHLAVVFVALTLAPASVLGWFGWKLAEQDRALEQRRVQERRERSADLIVTSLQQALYSDAQRLGDPSSFRRLSIKDAHIIVFTTDRVEISPETPLTYYPVYPALREAAADRFESGEQDEFRSHNFDAAIAKFRELARSADVAVRAGAEMRLARNLRKAGRLTEALKIYGVLGREDDVALPGGPASLVAQRARCALLGEMNRMDDLRREAERLSADLERGRWHLQRAQYRHYMNEVTRWLGSESRAPLKDDTLAAAASRLWEKWQSTIPAQSGIDGREIFQSSVLMWHATPSSMVALVAGPEYVKQQWFDRLEPILAGQNVRITIDSANALDSHIETERIASQTGLPWTIRVASANPQAEFAAYMLRRRLMLAGVALILVTICAGSYIVAKAVSRELALARLQSDFVSAVSHEFRTPLTSLSQVTEILSDGRVTNSDRLQQYYLTQARATGRLQRLVESLLDFGRMEAGTKPYHMQHVDARKVVESVVEEFRIDVAAEGYDIQLVTFPEPAPTLADPEALAHAIRNLLENAVKYSPECKTIQVGVARCDKYIAVSVCDQGFGIPAPEQKTIFRKFVRGAESKTLGIKGTGVGLAIVQHIIDAHHGKILLKSAPGAGSTFTLLFPESHVTNPDR